MKYKLYVSGCCNNTRNLDSDMGIGGVILNDNCKEVIFSKDVGKGTVIEAHVHAILYGIEEIISNGDVSSIEVYSTNLMIINYMNNKIIDIPIRIKPIIRNLMEFTEKLKLSINYEYLEVNDYKYVRNLAEEALRI